MCVKDATQPLRITIPVMISRQNRTVFEFNTDACERVAMSGVPLTLLIYMKKEGPKTPRVPLIDLSQHKCFVGQSIENKERSCMR